MTHDPKMYFTLPGWKGRNRQLAFGNMSAPFGMVTSVYAHNHPFDISGMSWDDYWDARAQDAVAELHFKIDANHSDLPQYRAFRETGFIALIIDDTPQACEL